MEKWMEETADVSMELYDFLRLKMGLTKRQISQLKFREQGILVDGEKSRVTRKLIPGNVVRVRLEDGCAVSSQLHFNDTLPEILYEDEDLCAVNKPSGVPTHPAGRHYEDSMANMLMAYFYRKGESLRIRPVGRLDLETSGVLLFAKSTAAAGRMAAQRERGLLKKEYLALVQGNPQPAEGIIDRPMTADPENPCRMIISPEGKRAVTRYRTVKTFEGGSCLSVTLETGRMHQIRCHMASMGHPLLGDRLYGGGGLMGRAALHARRLTFLQPFTGERICIEAPVPDDLKACLGLDKQDTNI